MTFVTMASHVISALLPGTDIDHFRDMGYVCTKNCMKNHMWEYNPDIVNDEKSTSWKKIPDKRVGFLFGQ